MTSQRDASATALCTIADLNYLPRTVALYRSLEATRTVFTLHILCMEPGAKALLERLELAHAVMLEVETLEAVDDALVRVKGSRTRGEYCWTLKPALCRFLLEALPDLGAVTYLDSDLFFFEDPRIVLDELGDNAIMLLPHRFPPEEPQWTLDDGIFNGGWVTFRSDARAFAALAWWRERCLEWCHDRREDGKFADQHYLDDWPQRFAGVRVITHHGAGLAPWNARRFRLELRDGTPRADGHSAVFYHYQSLRLPRAPRLLQPLLARLPGYRLMREPTTQLWWTGPEYELSEREVQVFWIPYLRHLSDAFEELRAADRAFDAGMASVPGREVGAVLGRRLLSPGLRRRIRQVQHAFEGLSRDRR